MHTDVSCSCSTLLIISLLPANFQIMETILVIFTSCLFAHDADMK